MVPARVRHEPEGIKVHLNCSYVDIRRLLGRRARRPAMPPHDTELPRGGRSWQLGERPSGTSGSSRPGGTRPAPPCPAASAPSRSSLPPPLPGRHVRRRRPAGPARDAHRAPREARRAWTTCPAAPPRAWRRSPGIASPVPVARHAGQGRGRPALTFCASRGTGAVLAASSGATAVSTVVPGCSSEPPDTKLHVGQRPVVHRDGSGWSHRRVRAGRRGSGAGRGTRGVVDVVPCGLAGAPGAGCRLACAD